jgi:uncharacterized protein YabN with tetrapyrrole methylase and pyrophosphatase domain
VSVNDILDVATLETPIDLWGWKGLTIVGTGIRAGLQTTPEARVCIEQSSRVYYLLADAISENWLRGLKPDARSLLPLYGSGKARAQTYAEIVETVMAALREFRDVCLVFYGHSGVFVAPPAELRRTARSAGYQVRMLPGVSALDNLFSDLGLDPGITGLQSYEATAFMLRAPIFEPSAPLVLWQIGVLGEKEWRPQAPQDRAISGCYGTDF